MNPVFHSASPACLQSCLIQGSFMKQMANWTEQLCSFHFSISCCLIKHQCSLDSTQSSVWLGRIKGALLSRKSSWQAGALRLIKLKPRVGRHRPLLAPESPGVKPCSMLLFPAPSRPSTRTWRFPRSSSSCRQTAELLMFANAWKCWVEAKIKHITYSTQSEGEAFGFWIFVLHFELTKPQAVHQNTGNICTVMGQVGGLRTSRRTLQQNITSRSEHQLF